MTGITLTEALPGLGPVSTSGYRPWWETIRLYLLNTLLAISIMVFYASYNFPPTNCIPRKLVREEIQLSTEAINSSDRTPYADEMTTSSSTTEFVNPTNRAPDIEETSSLSASETKFVNPVCFLQINRIFRFVGKFVLIGCLVLYGAYSWWELFPKVKNRFFTVKDVDKLLAGEHLAKFQIKKLVASRENKIVEDVLHRLFFTFFSQDVLHRLFAFFSQDVLYRLFTLLGQDPFHRLFTFLSQDVLPRLFTLLLQSNSLFGLYIARNLIALVCVGIEIWLAWEFHERSSEEIGGTFNCSLDSDAAAEVGAAEFLCSNSLPSQLDLHFLAIFALLIVLAVITAIILIVSIIVMCRTKVSKNLSPDGRTLCMDYAFVLFFSQSSLGLHDSTKEMLSLFEDDFVLDKMIEGDFVWNKALDKGRILLFLHLRKNGAKKLANQIDTFIKGKPKSDFCERANYDYFSLALESLAGFHALFEILFSKKEYKAFLQLHDILFVEFNSSGLSELTVLGLIHDRCCCGITLTKEHLADKDFVKELQARYGLSYGQRVIMHILLKLLPEEERSEFLDKNTKIFSFTTRLKSRNMMDKAFLSRELSNEAKINKIVPRHLQSLNARLDADGRNNTTILISREENSSQGLQHGDQLSFMDHLFSIVRVPGDGSCFFEAIINQLFFHLHRIDIVVGEQTDNTSDLQTHSDSDFLEEKIQECMNKLGRHCAVFEATARAIGHRILIVHLNEDDQRTFYPFGSSGRILCLALKNKRFWILSPKPSDFSNNGDFLLNGERICRIDECFKPQGDRISDFRGALRSTCDQLLDIQSIPTNREDETSTPHHSLSSPGKNAGVENKSRVPPESAQPVRSDASVPSSSHTPPGENVPLLSVVEESSADS